VVTKKNGRSAETPPSRSSAAAVRAVAETLAEDVAPVEFRLANGCLLGIKPVAPFLIRRAVTKLDRPSPPKVLIQDKGREEEVPDDPTGVPDVDDNVPNGANSGLKDGFLVTAVLRGQFWNVVDGTVLGEEAVIFSHLGADLFVDCTY